MKVTVTVKDRKETAKTPEEKLKRFREHKATIALCKALGTSVSETPIQFIYYT